jgi:hypothetical protein
MKDVKLTLHAADIVAQPMQVLKALRDTIEQALLHRQVRCRSDGHKWDGHVCRILAVHVDCYTGVALKLASLEAGGAMVNFVNPEFDWVQASQCELPDACGIYP